MGKPSLYLLFCFFLILSSCSDLSTDSKDDERLRHEQGISQEQYFNINKYGKSHYNPDSILPKEDESNGFCFVVRKFIFANNSELILDVIKDNKSNLILMLKDKDGFLIKVDGNYNSEVANGDTSGFLISTHLDNDKIPEFIAKTVNMSSTYGAMLYFVIWYDGQAWTMSKLETTYKGVKEQVIWPLIEDRDGDGIFEIIENYQSIDENGDVFRWKKGELIK